MALAVTQPADAGRKALERDALFGETEPALQPPVLRKQLEKRAVGRPNVFRLARKRGPPERPLALAEERPDVQRHEAADREGVGDTGLLRLSPEIVAVVEDDRAAPPELEQRAHVIGHGRVGPLDVPFRIRHAQARQLLERAAPRNVAVELVVGRGLIGDEIGQDVAGEQPLEQIHGIRLDADRDSLSRVLRREGAIDGAIDVGLLLVQIAGLQPLLDALRIHLGHQRDRSVHRRGERLRAAHPAETGGHDQPAREIASEVPGRGRERLERPLDDALAADVDPRARRHLAVHGQAEAFQAAELVARRPGGNEHGVRDEDPRGVFVGFEHADGLPRLDEHRLVGSKALQRRDDGVERFPVARGPAGAAVDDQFFGLFRHVRIEVVLEHPEGGFLRPAEAAELRSTGRANRAGGRQNGRAHGRIIWRGGSVAGLPAGLLQAGDLRHDRLAREKHPRVLEIRMELPVGGPGAHLAAEEAPHAFQRLGGGQRPQELHRLKRRDELDGEHALQVFHDRRELPRRDRRHRDVVLLGGRGRDRIDRGGMREHLAFRDQRGGRHLRHHEPRVQAPLPHQERREGPKAPG